MHATLREVEVLQAMAADDDPDTSDMPLHRAGTPRPCDPSFDRVVIFLQPLGKALQGLVRTSGALEPGIERRRCRWRTSGVKSCARSIASVGPLETGGKFER
jgi:hypothetical protein